MCELSNCIDNECKYAKKCKFEESGREINDMFCTKKQVGIRVDLIKNTDCKYFKKD